MGGPRPPIPGAASEPLSSTPAFLLSSSGFHMTAPRRLNMPLQEVPKPQEESALRTRPKILPATDLVDSIIQQGIARRASDIHLEPSEHGMNVRFRVDGLLQTAEFVPAEARAAVISRIKILGN